MSDLNNCLDTLSPWIREYKDVPLLVIGDFNSMHARWDPKKQNREEKSLNRGLTNLICILLTINLFRYALMFMDSQ